MSDVASQLFEREAIRELIARVGRLLLTLRILLPSSLPLQNRGAMCCAHTVPRLARK